MMKTNHRYDHQLTADCCLLKKKKKNVAISFAQSSAIRVITTQFALDEVI